MVSYPTPKSVQFNTFKGIRTRNGIASGGIISAVECKNIDFIASSYDAGVNIATSLGNTKRCEYSSENDLYAYRYENNLIYTKSTTITGSTVLYDASGNVNTDDTWAVELEDETYVIKYGDETAHYSKKDNIYEYTIVAGFEFKSETDTHLLFYVKNATNGLLVEYKNNTLSLIDTSYYEYDSNTQQWEEITINVNSWLSATDEANGITMVNNAYNTFVFTNGIDYYAWCPDQTIASLVLRKLEPKYYDENLTSYVNIKGLPLAELEGSLVIGGNNGIVLGSRKDDITDFDYVLPTDDNKAWYEPFGKPITALVNMTGGLIVFTDENNTLLSNWSTISTRDRKDANLGGCMSFESWVKHDKYLFFYDNRQKNIYYYAQNDYGQMVLGEPVAPEVQKYFSDVNRLQMTSYIGNNRSEIWVLTDKNKLIFDFYIQEWAERNCQELNGYFVFNNNVYSVGKNACFQEKAGNIGVFDGDFYGSEYKTQIINLGSFSNMKEMEFQPLLSVATDHNNAFYIDCLIDGKKIKSKYVQMYYSGAVWGDDTPQTENTPSDELWDIQAFPIENENIIQQVKGKFVSNWYYLQFTFRTETQGDDFSITCMELKGITQETDTTGRK